MNTLKKAICQKYLLLLTCAALQTGILDASNSSQDTEIKEPAAKRARTLEAEQAKLAVTSQPPATAAQDTVKAERSYAFANAQHILRCQAVNSSFQDGSDAESVTIPSYAPELSQWVLDRRLARLAPDIDFTDLKETLKERFDYNDIYLSTTSTRFFDQGDYRIIVNHVSIDIHDGYRSCFDIFLRDRPQDLLIECTMKAPQVRFESGLCIRDVYGLCYTFSLLTNNIFPDGVLEKHFAGTDLLEEEKTPEIQQLLHEILYEDILSEKILDQINFIPFIR